MQRIMKARYFVDKCDIKPPDHTIIACRIILIEGERAGGGGERVGGASVSLKWELEGGEGLQGIFQSNILILPSQKLQKMHLQ